MINRQACTRAWLLAPLLIGCGGATASQGAAHPEAHDEEAGSEIIISPKKPAPPALSNSEKKELAGRCAEIEPEIYDADKQALAALKLALDGDGPHDAAEKNALKAAVSTLKGKSTKLGDDQKQCLALFEIRTRRRLFEFEPVEETARMAVDSCIRRVENAFGSQKLSYDMDGSVIPGSQGPFCPDDDPVPMSMSQLPYKSTSDDWDTATWICLKFGLRTKQRFQIEYVAPYESRQFQCIARFLPRQGGAPIEIIKGGKVSDEGELKMGKVKKRRMRADH